MNKEFCLKTMPWLIKINNELEWDIVNDWLMKISGNRVHCNYVGHSIAFTNYGPFGLEDRFMWTVVYGGEEIKLNF